MKLFLIAAAAAIAAPAAATTFTDPGNDYLATYVGPRNADLDVLSGSATFNATGVTLTTQLAGAVGGTAGSLFLWGVDRGSGTNRLITSGPPAVGPNNVLLDSVIRLLPDGTGAVVNFPVAGAPTTTPLDPGSVTVSGSTISAFVPFSLLPTTGFAAADYTYIFWTRSAAGGQEFIADLAPDNRSFAASPVPEPASWMMMIGGFGLTGGVMRARRPMRARPA